MTPLEKITKITEALRVLHRDEALTGQDRAIIMSVDELLRNLTPFRAHRKAALAEMLGEDLADVTMGDEKEPSND